MADTQKEQEKSWLDSLSEILSRPLPGTAVPGREPIEKPVVFNETDDDDSLLDRITDILSKPISGADAGQAGQTAGRENPGEAAVRDAAEPDADPVSTTAAASADWMQREYERFYAYQDRNRKAFAEQQRVEQERFLAFQKQQLEAFGHSQQRELNVFKQHQNARSQMWRQDLRQAYGPPGGPGLATRPSRPGMMPRPPPPWWRKR